MFSEYDKSNFPLVKIQLGKTIQDNTEYQLFIEEWKNLYKREKNFQFIIDASMTGFVPFTYAFKMKDFLNELKKMKHQYLERSIIIINNRIVEYTLRFIFSITRPVAPVYLVYSKEDALNLHNLLSLTRFNIGELNEKLKLINYSCIQP